MGRPIVIQPPAWGPTGDYLRLTLAPLLGEARCITYDPRNVGDAPRVAADDAQATEHLVADLEEVRAGLGLERFVLVGHSHGGFIAMGYAARHPEHLDALILLNTSLDRRAGADEVDAMLEAMAADPARGRAIELFRETGGRLRADDDRDLARQMRSLMPAYFYRLDAMQRFAELARVARPPSAEALLRVPDELEPWVAAELSGLAVPTLVITGAHDVATPPAASRQICELITGARLEIFERSGHHPWIEEPELFAETVRRFLAEVDSASR